MSELEKQAKIGRQAMNIQIMEMLFRETDSDGRPIDGSEYTKMALYNLETISAEEVEAVIKSGMQNQDSRIIMAWPDEIANVFPHRDEAKKDGIVTYWKPSAYRGEHGDKMYCECSACGLKVPVAEAVEYGSYGYTGVKYRFCPKCGSMMYHKPTEQNFNTQLAVPDNDTDPIYDVKVKDAVVKVTGEDIDDIMESALMGCVYWCSHADVVGKYLGKYASEQISRGGSLIFYDAEDERSSTELTRDKFLTGLRMLLETQNGLHGLMVEYRGDNTYINPGMIDANAADSLIQYALFGDIIYS